MGVFAAEILPFQVAIGLVLAIGAVEVIGLLFGFAPLQSMDRAFGASEAATSDGRWRRVLRWLGLCQFPALIIVLTLLMSFALIGLGEQWAAQRMLGHALHPALACVPAALSAIVLTHLTGRGLAWVTRGEHAPAEGTRNFVGRIATVMHGSATIGRPAQARLVDLDGKVHYVLVEPQDINQTLPEGTEVVVVRQEGLILRVAAHPDS